MKAFLVEVCVKKIKNSEQSLYDGHPIGYILIINRKT
jgi:hypothetical protein